MVARTTARYARLSVNSWANKLSLYCAVWNVLVVFKRLSEVFLLNWPVSSSDAYIPASKTGLAACFCSPRIVCYLVCATSKCASYSGERSQLAAAVRNTPFSICFRFANGSHVTSQKVNNELTSWCCTEFDIFAVTRCRLAISTWNVVPFVVFSGCE